MIRDCWIRFDGLLAFSFFFSLLYRFSVYIQLQYLFHSMKWIHCVTFLPWEKQNKMRQPTIITATSSQSRKKSFEERSGAVNLLFLSTRLLIIKRKYGAYLVMCTVDWLGFFNSCDWPILWEHWNVFLFFVQTVFCISCSVLPVSTKFWCQNLGVRTTLGTCHWFRIKLGIRI